MRPKNCRLARALRVGYRARSCGTSPLICLTSVGSVRMSWPPIRAVPDVGSSTPVSIEIVVVLPAPFGPSRPKTSPSSTAKLMPSTAT